MPTPSLEGISDRLRRLPATALKVREAAEICEESPFRNAKSQPARNTGGGTRTLTLFRALNFESSASANSATPASVYLRIIGPYRVAGHCVGRRGSNHVDELFLAAESPKRRPRKTSDLRRSTCFGEHWNHKEKRRLYYFRPWSPPQGSPTWWRGTSPHRSRCDRRADPAPLVRMDGQRLQILTSRVPRVAKRCRRL